MIVMYYVGRGRSGRLGWLVGRSQSVRLAVRAEHTQACDMPCPALPCPVQAISLLDQISIGLETHGAHHPLSWSMPQSVQAGSRRPAR